MAVNDNINFWSDSNSQQDSSVVAQDQVINTEPSSIFNEFAFRSGNDGGQNFTYAMHSAESALIPDIGHLDNDIAVAQSKMQSLLMEAELILSKCEPGSEEYNQAAASCSAIQMGIAQLSAASNGGVAAKTSALSYVATTFNAGNASINVANAAKNADAAAYAYQQQLEYDQAERARIQQDASYAASLGLGGLSAENLEFTLADIYERDPQLRGVLDRSELFQTNQVFSSLQEESQDRNAQALAGIRSDANLMADPKMQNILQRLEQVNNRNARFSEEETYFIANAYEEYRSGAITQEQLAEKLENGLQIREQAAADIAQQSLDILNSDTERQVLMNMVRERYGANPTNEQMQEFLATNAANNTELNHAQAFIKARMAEGMSREDAFKALQTYEQQQGVNWSDDLVLATARSVSELRQIDFNIREMVTNFDGPQMERFIGEIESLVEQGKMVEAVDALIASGNIPPEVAENMRRMAREDPEMIQSVISQTINSVKQGGEQQFDFTRVSQVYGGLESGLSLSQMRELYQTNPDVMEQLGEQTKHIAELNAVAGYNGGQTFDYTIDFTKFEADEITFLESMFSGGDFKNVSFVKSEALDSLVDNSQQNIAPENAVFANALAGTEFANAEFGFASDFSFAVSDVQEIGAPPTISMPQEQQLAYAR